MRKLTFEIDYSFCPQGHDWTFLPASTMYSDIFWCADCGCFYYPSVKKLTPDQLNKDFRSDRAAELVRYAEFRKWRDGLSIKDMPKNVAIYFCKKCGNGYTSQIFADRCCEIPALENKCEISR